MARPRFYVRTDKKNATIYFNISIAKGVRLTGKTDQTIYNPKNFDKDDHGIKELNDFSDKVDVWLQDLKGNPDAREILDDKIKNLYNRADDEFTKKKKIDLLEFFDEKIKDLRRKNKSPKTIHHYILTKQYLEEFAKHKKVKSISYRYITDVFLEKFEEYLMEDHSQGYANLLIGKLTAVMNFSCKKGHHNYTSHQAFETKEVFPFDVYLKEDEVQKLRSLDLEGEDCAIRDYFILLCRMGSRVKDALQWNSENIKTINDQKFIVYRHSKTKKLHPVPVTPEIEEILQRWNNFPNKEGNFPNERDDINIYYAKINTKISSIVKQAGIDYLVTDNSNPDGIVTKPKYEWVKSHTGKRTAATLAYLGGMPLWEIRGRITLHSSEKTTLNYIKLDDEIEAQMILNGDLKIA